MIQILTLIMVMVINNKNLLILMKIWHIKEYNKSLVMEIKNQNKKLKKFKNILILFKMVIILLLIIIIQKNLELMK